VTTIAADPVTGVIAYESRITRGDYILDDDCDKCVIRDGIAFFVAGDVAHEQQFIDQYPDGKIDKHADLDAFVVIDGQVNLAGVEEGRIWSMPLNKPYAIGVGGPIAVGAMAYGASVEDAVQIAIDHTQSSGGKVRTFKL